MKLSILALRLLDRLTDISPAFVPIIFHKSVLHLLGNKLIYELIQKIYRNKLRKIGKLNKICIIVDINIGDSIIVQPAVKVLKYYFHDAQIDYVCNKTGGELVEDMAEAANIIKIYIKKGIPTEQEENEIKDIINQNCYDLILNFCPFLKLQNFINSKKVIHIYVPLSSYIIRLWKINDINRHISYSIHHFMLNFLEMGKRRKEANKLNTLPGKANPFYQGNRIYISDEDIKEAKDFLMNLNLLNKAGIVMFHPDTPSIYTLIPHKMQIDLLTRILKLDEISAVLIGIGRSFKDIEKRVISGLPEELKHKIFVIPDIKINTYAALIDISDIFISGDTGPLHIAAAQRLNRNPDSRLKIRNKTIIATIFGATDSMMYGYDSGKENYLPASQDAPSRVFISNTKCRNISCIDKLMKSCRHIRCFDGINTDSITDYIKSYLPEIMEDK